MRSPRVRVATAALLAATAATAIFAVTGATGATRQAKGVARGTFSTILMVHTLTAPPTTPWTGRLKNGGSYSYRSIACNGQAPVNNISSDLPSYNGRVAGSTLPNSLRGHPFAFKTVKTRAGWQMRGTITMTVCKLGSGPTATPDPIADTVKPKIFVRFSARFKRMSSADISWRGTFRLAGGTGRYRGLTGTGSIAGYFLCFDPQGCAALGSYRDAQFVMHGNYSDPTPQLNG